MLTCTGRWRIFTISCKQRSNEITELDLYLKATKWHSDTYPWRIQASPRRGWRPAALVEGLATTIKRKRIEDKQVQLDQTR